ncbi:hypothetical protein O181_015657 [Austropuccinia psidii MF-1]|uniref:Uncharacterized protein n=1 Tax=Austropuccinia psidii MF-1 TaxID=1389203 RepID=A0A9Q3C2I5_9BASI|nr:hypothetical protein [Austropuccinia psidii MF-1]
MFLAEGPDGTSLRAKSGIGGAQSGSADMYSRMKTKIEALDEPVQNRQPVAEQARLWIDSNKLSTAWAWACEGCDLIHCCIISYPVDPLMSSLGKILLSGPEFFGPGLSRIVFRICWLAVEGHPGPWLRGDLREDVPCRHQSFHVDLLFGHGTDCAPSDECSLLRIVLSDIDVIKRRALRTGVWCSTPMEAVNSSWAGAGFRSPQLFPSSTPLDRSFPSTSELSQYTLFPSEPPQINRPQALMSSSASRYRVAWILDLGRCGLGSHWNFSLESEIASFASLNLKSLVQNSCDSNSKQSNSRVVFSATTNSFKLLIISSCGFNAVPHLKALNGRRSHHSRSV